MKNRAAVFCLVTFTLLVAQVSGQGGVSSMSYSAASAGIYLNFESIKVEEFINYHRHQLPLPHKGEPVSYTHLRAHETLR